MVSCNPKTFWEDVNILKNYNLIRHYGVDQFYATNHLEIVGVLEKK
jgi:tRNA/tmRNA/rRNA uracil-C5-methylase (TrmA/RlmC/RlmD family)